MASNNNFRHPKEHNNLWVCSWRFPPRDAMFQVVISAKDKSEALEALGVHVVNIGHGEAPFDALVENLDTLLGKGLVAWSDKVTVEPAYLSARLSSWESGGRWDGTDKPPAIEDTTEQEVSDEELLPEGDIDPEETKEYMRSLETV